MTPKEKWQRLTNPKTLADYQITISLSELMEVSEAVEALQKHGIINKPPTTQNEKFKL